MGLKQSVKIMIFGGLILVLLLPPSMLIWGGTSRMAYANHLFNDGESLSAQGIYEELAIDLPRSPYVLENLGLSLYQQRLYRQASVYLRKAVNDLLSQHSNPVRREKLVELFRYHLGNALYKSALQDQLPKKTQEFQEALLNYKQVLGQDPNNRDAKYNYELTMLQLQELLDNPPNNPPPPDDPEPNQYQPPVIPKPPVGKDW